MSNKLSDSYITVCFKKYDLNLTPELLDVFHHKLATMPGHRLDNWWCNNIPKLLKESGAVTELEERHIVLICSSFEEYLNYDFEDNWGSFRAYSNCMAKFKIGLGLEFEFSPVPNYIKCTTCGNPTPNNEDGDTECGHCAITRSMGKK